ncbi:uncharacterized protein LOC129907130 [Episyrphus balteatus]|uniref:uncharacterized protein LOC129907130 n=1 Tax=Episyrphus balteatus TaxID=286459 RepID=UPI002485EB59|nr:uncharacterized protein LOC129907130 [Episyrphus balteatus]
MPPKDDPQSETLSAANYVKPPKPLQITGGNLSSAWKNWIQLYKWIEIAAQLNKKPEEIQVATFMSCIGADAANIYNSFSFTEAETDKVSSIINKFNEYFSPRVSLTFERYTFNTLTQREGESFEEFLTKIKNQSKKCAFENLEDSLLRDKIVTGIRNDSLREKLLAEDDIKLDQAIKVCRASEIASQQLRDLHKPETAAVDAIKKYNPHYYKKSPKAKSSFTYTCRNCGTEHEKNKCPAYKQKCQHCKRTGHFTDLCFQRRKKFDKKKKVYTLQEGTQPVNESDNTSDDSSGLFVLALTKSETNKDETKNWYEEIKIEEKTIKVNLDTAAQCNVLPVSLIKKSNLQKIKPTKQKIIAFGGTEIDVRGELSLDCVVRNKNRKIKFLIVKDFPDFEPILGKDDCEKCSLVLRVQEINLDNEIFQGLGKVKDFVYDIDLIDNPKFEHYAPRKIPHSIRDDVKKEIDNMLRLGVLIKTDGFPPAVSPMVVVRKKDKIRVCIDPTDVNKNIRRRYHPLLTIEQITANIKGSKFFTLLDCTRGFWQIEVSKRTQQYLTMSTPWGLFSFTRIPFGLACAPEVYQSYMQTILEGCQNTDVAIDDILIHAKTQEELQQLTDSYSGFFDYTELKQTTSTEVIKALKVCFATHGIPSVLESDTGPQFASREFANFAKDWDIQHQTSSPYYPRSNGLAERYVQTAKSMLKKCFKDQSDPYIALLNYRNSPRNEVLQSPNQRLMSRLTRTTLPVSPELLKPKIIPDVHENITKMRQNYKSNYDNSATPSKLFHAGDRVRIQRNHRDWITGVVEELPKHGPRSLVIRTDDGKLLRRNTIHIQPTKSIIQAPKSVTANIPPSNSDSLKHTNNRSKIPNTPDPTTSTQINKSPDSTNSPAKTTRYGRVLRQPDRYTSTSSK